MRFKLRYPGSSPNESQPVPGRLKGPWTHSLYTAESRWCWTCRLSFSWHRWPSPFRRVKTYDGPMQTCCFSFRCIFDLSVVPRKALGRLCVASCCWRPLKDVQTRTAMSTIGMHLKVLAVVIVLLKPWPESYLIRTQTFRRRILNNFPLKQALQ